MNLWRRWVGLAVLVVVLTIAFVRLGEWQLHRLETRRSGNAIIAANTAAPVRDWTQVWRPVITDADAWQRVQITGTFDAAHQFRALYRNDSSGAQGSAAITPLVTASGTAVLIDRGFLPRSHSEPGEALPAPPSGTVTVIGYVRRDEQGNPNLVTPHEGQMRLVNSGQIGAVLPYPVANGWVQLISVQPEQSGDLTPQGVPLLSEGPHLSYAIQWFLFTLVVVLGSVVLIRGDLRVRRQAARDASSTTSTTTTRTAAGASAGEEDENGSQADR